MAAWPELRFDVEAMGDVAPKVLEALDGRIVKLNLTSIDEAVAEHKIDCSSLETLVVNLPHELAEPCSA